MSSRREKGTGNVYQRENGSWVGRVDIGRKSDGSRKIKYFSGKTEAQVRKKIREYNKLSNNYEPEKITVEEYAWAWLKRYKANTIRGSSYDRLENALSERLVCGECGTLYRRCTWAKKGKKRVVWRCVSHLDYGTKYCHNSPSMEEEPLQRAILAAINSMMRDKQELIQEITGAMELELPPLPGVNMSIVEIEKQLDELNKQTRALVTQAAHAENAAAYAEQLKKIMDEAAALKEKRAEIEELQQENSQANLRIETAAAVMEKVTAEITQWDESVIRGLVDTVKAVSAEQIVVCFRGGGQTEQSIVY